MCLRNDYVGVLQSDSISCFCCLDSASAECAKSVKCDKGNRFSTTYQKTLNWLEFFGKYPVQRMAIVMATTGMLRSYFYAFW